MYHVLGQTLTLFLWLASRCCMNRSGNFHTDKCPSATVAAETVDTSLPLTPREINLGALLVSSKPRPDIEIWCLSPAPRRLQQFPYGASSKSIGTTRPINLILLCTKGICVWDQKMNTIKKRDQQYSLYFPVSAIVKEHGTTHFVSNLLVFCFFWWAKVLKQDKWHVFLVTQVRHVRLVV